VGSSDIMVSRYRRLPLFMLSHAHAHFLTRYNSISFYYYYCISLVYHSNSTYIQAGYLSAKITSFLTIPPRVRSYVQAFKTIRSKLEPSYPSLIMFLRMPIGLSIHLLARINLVQFIECLCDRSDTADKQHYHSIILAFIRNNRSALELTAWNDHPYEIHRKIISPEVEKLRPAVGNLLVVEVECVGSIVEDEAVNLSHANDDLERVAERMRSRDHSCYDEAKRAPGELQTSIRIKCGRAGEGMMEIRTAVTVSMHSTKGSEVRYRESDNAYSFHSCPKRSWAGPICVWLREKYPIPNQFPLINCPIISALTFKEEMYGASYQIGQFLQAQLVNWRDHTQNQPPDCSLFTRRKVWVYPANNCPRSKYN
jgi:hypothetical protein